MAGTQRYWDGSKWTDHIAPSAPVAVVVNQQPTTGVSDAMLTIGYLGAIFLPLLGGIIGIVAMAKGKTGHGVAILALSCVTFAVYLNAIYNGYI
jgi:hypothetical protein